MISEDTWYHVKIKYDITNLKYAVVINNTYVASGNLTANTVSSMTRTYLGHFDSGAEMTSYFDLFNADSGIWSNY